MFGSNSAMQCDSEHPRFSVFIFFIYLESAHSQEEDAVQARGSQL